MDEVKDVQQQYSGLGHALALGAENPSADPLVKKIFGNREVLAWLLKECVDEYRDCSVEDIRQYYLAGVSVAFKADPVHAWEASPDGAPAASTEDKSLLEGTTVFDVLLKLPVPGDAGGNIGVVINIEVQNDLSPGYRIEKRMLYYLCRLVSGERGTVFTGSDYGSICKAYSLWFCPRLTTGTEPSVDCYRIGAERLYGVGGPDCQKKDYDLIEGICCKFNGGRLRTDDRLLRYLQLLLTDTASPSERLGELNEKYGISKTQEAEDMSNYTQFLIDEYTRKGMEKGMEKGREEGMEKGREEGMEKGMEKGKLEVLERFEQKHMDEETIMFILNVDATQLAKLRQTLNERRQATNENEAVKLTS